MAIAVSKTANPETLDRAVELLAHGPNYPDADWWVFNEAQHPAQVAQIRALIAGGVASRYWTRSGANVVEMNAAQKLTVDTALLAVRKTEARRLLIQKFETFIGNRYAELESRLLLAILGSSASATQKAAIRDWNDWLVLVADAAVALNASISAAAVGTDPVDLVNNYDHSALVSADPGTTFASVRAL